MTDDKKMTRCFIAIDLPEEAKKSILNMQAMLKESKTIDAKYTEKDNLHLTLKFLGEIDQTLLEETKSRLAKIRWKRFRFMIGEAGTFSKESARIVWVRLVSGDLDRLQKDIDSKLEDLFKKERRFMAHVTIARVKQVKDDKKMIETIKKIRFDYKEHDVKSFILKKSTLSKEGPIYQNLLAVDLG